MSTVCLLVLVRQLEHLQQDRFALAFSRERDRRLTRDIELYPWAALAFEVDQLSQRCGRSLFSGQPDATRDAGAGHQAAAQQLLPCQLPVFELFCRQRANNRSRIVHLRPSVADDTTLQCTTDAAKLNWR